MEEITFEDFLTHYTLKLQEVNDGIQKLENELKKTAVSLESGWQGPAADEFRLKLEEINNGLQKTKSNLSEAMVKLSAIGEMVADGEEITV